MEKTYEVVPNIISDKDLDYLSDMFSWNYGCLKSTNEAILKVQDESLREVLRKGLNLFKNNLMEVLSILQGGNNE